MKLIIISGRSGSGKSIALRALEDLGYYCVDNMPVILLVQLIHAVASDYDRVAVSIDARNIPMEPGVVDSVLDELKTEVDVTTIFLDSSDGTLLKRFSETRRMHPLTERGDYPLVEAIKQESKLLDVMRQQSDLVINTDDKTLYELADLVRERILGKKTGKLIISFVSFGFKNGLPSDADFVFDARCLPNPHWIPELQEYTGLELPVASYLSNQPLVVKFVCQVQEFIESWLPHLERSNRSYVTIAIGCTGGKHRSVYSVKRLADYFTSQLPDMEFKVVHRELKRHD